MWQAASVWLTALAFFGAGLFNAIGTPATQRDFVRWGYPAWWCRVTGGLEIATAVLIGWPVTREAGLVLGTIVIAAAILTVLRHRAFSHLTPLGLFVALLALAGLGPLFFG
jgi:hypothetical protein